MVTPNFKGLWNILKNLPAFKEEMSKEWDKKIEKKLENHPYTAKFCERCGSDHINCKGQTKCPKCLDLMAACPHSNMGVKFDKEAAKGLTSDEIRKLWPRGHNLTCPDCGQFFDAYYASYEHYIMGDY